MKETKFSIWSLAKWIEKQLNKPVFETIIISKKGNLFLQRDEEGPIDKIECVKNPNKQCSRSCSYFESPKTKSVLDIIIDYPFDKSLCRLTLCDNHTLNSWYVVDPSSDNWAEPEDIKEILKQIEGE